MNGTPGAAVPARAGAPATGRLTHMDHLITVANLLFVSAYLVRDVLVLRILALSGAACLAAYFAALSEPLLQAVYWNLFYVALNTAWISRLVVARRSARDPGSPGTVVLYALKRTREWGARPIGRNRQPSSMPRETACRGDCMNARSYLAAGNEQGVARIALDAPP